MDDRDFRRRLLAGEELIGTFLNLGSASSAELCVRAGFDWAIIDLEHGFGTEADLLGQLRAFGGAAAVPMVRLEQGTRMRIARVLDLGARGVMVPRVERLEETEEVVRSVRWPPAGARGLALMTRGAGLGRTAHTEVGALAERLVTIIQVENRLALEAAPELAAVDGADVLFVGPTDLTHALGIPGEVDHADYQAAIERVGRAARDAGKAAGVLLWRPDQAPRYRDAGFTMLGISSDASMINDTARGLVRALRPD